MTETLETVRRNGNVFADMGLEDTDALMVRAQLGHAVRKISFQSLPRLIARDAPNPVVLRSPLPKPTFVGF